ncbi:hypothetical protein BDF14DRAFT_285454 [Spinellus fusiger]|nr:hypothetical protein BDF14DRAFT_285454 [Spinellus fusiger]
MADKRDCRLHMFIKRSTQRWREKTMAAFYLSFSISAVFWLCFDSYLLIIFPVIGGVNPSHVFFFSVFLLIWFFLLLFLEYNYEPRYTLFWHSISSQTHIYPV